MLPPQVTTPFQNLHQKILNRAPELALSYKMKLNQPKNIMEVKSRAIINFLGQQTLYIFSEIGRSLEKVPFHNPKLKSVKEDVV